MEGKPRMAKASLAASALGASGASGAKVQLPESDTRVSHAAQKRAGLVLVAGQQANSSTGERTGQQASRPAGNQDSVSRAERSKSPNLKGLESQRQPVSSRKRSASVPATSPVTKM